MSDTAPGRAPQPDLASQPFRTAYVPHDDARPLVWDAYIDGRCDICSPDGASLSSATNAESPLTR